MPDSARRKPTGLVAAHGELAVAEDMRAWANGVVVVHAACAADPAFAPDGRWYEAVKVKVQKGGLSSETAKTLDELIQQAGTLLDSFEKVLENRTFRRLLHMTSVLTPPDPESKKAVDPLEEGGLWKTAAFGVRSILRWDQKWTPGEPSKQVEGHVQSTAGPTERAKKHWRDPSAKVEVMSEFLRRAESEVRHGEPAELDAVGGWNEECWIDFTGLGLGPLPRFLELLLFLHAEFGDRCVFRRS